MIRKPVFLLLAAVAIAAGGIALAGPGPGGPGGAATSQVFDTSAAVEASSSCLGGGCHESNAKLLEGYKASYMTHAMVKCNACHGTHTAAEVGQPKPHLTGYLPGAGPTGYVVGDDRCLACHSASGGGVGHPNNPGACTGCHAPHAFAK